MALHRVEVLETAIRVGAASLVIDGQMTMVNPTWRARAEISSQVRLGPAVTKIVGDCLHFRRCRQTWALSDVEARLIRAIADAPDVPELASRLGVDNQCALEQVRVLERQRAVTLALSEA